jgi:redox-sensitive bicupin YhaK (pirin superfamily)
MGNNAVIRQGDVQVMSAGTGIFHSEKNRNEDQQVKFLQIWVIPEKRNVQPRYDQITLDETKLDNRLYQILSPNADDEGVWVHQNAWFHLGNLKTGFQERYSFKGKGNGLYAFVLEGNVTIGGQKLERRDGLGITETDAVDIQADGDARLLLIEVPMLN